MDGLEENLNEKLKNTYDVKKGRVDLARQFSLINLPSNGLYYPSKTGRLLIRYLTAAEEHVLCDSMLMESGIGIKLVLNSLIIDDIDVEDLLLNDFQAILIFLRSTSYGDSVSFPINCPHCGNNSEYEKKLSQLEYKESVDFKNHDIVLECLGKKFEIKISPITLKDEINKADNDDEDFFTFKNVDGIETKIRRTRSISLASHIKSINGIEDKKKIKSIIRKFPKKYFNEILKFIEKNEVGVEETLSFSCPFCGEDFKQKILIGYDFLTLPESYKENVYEEVFLLTYYGKCITREDVFNMPVFERKWHIQRIKKEIEEQNKAEKAAMQRAKSSKGKF
jgi:hypothetical protein